MKRRLLAAFIWLWAGLFVGFNAMIAWKFYLLWNVQ